MRLFIKNILFGVHPLHATDMETNCKLYSYACVCMFCALNDCVKTAKKHCFSVRAFSVPGGVYTDLAEAGVTDGDFYKVNITN
jgi:hypothetical protein